MKFDFSARDLNGMSEEERKQILSGGFSRWKMEQSARYVAPFWWIEPRQSRVLITPPNPRIHNGSAFFAEIEGKLLCITAAHVYRGFLEARKHYPGLWCRLGAGDFAFDPEACFCDSGDERQLGNNIDIATFHITPDILSAIDKEPIIVPKGSWPPRHPFSQQESSVVGFPASLRLWADARSISFGYYYGSPRVGTATDRQITLPFEREYWVDALGHGIPPKGMDLGGMSGGPLLFVTEKDRDWSFNIGGVISEMPPSAYYETMIAVPAHFIDTDGRILDARNIPIRQYVLEHPAS